MGIGLVALILVAAVGLILFDLRRQVEGQDVALRERMRETRSDAREELQSVKGSVDDLVRSMAEARAELSQRFDRERAALDERLRLFSDEGRQVVARVDALGATTDDMRETFGEVKRHDQELVALQKRYSALADGLDGLERSLKDLETSAARAPDALSAEGEPTSQPVQARPAWIGLVDQLKSADASQRWQAVIALGETRDPAVSPHLVGALQDEDIFIRMASARVLGDLRSPKAIPALIAALEDKESAVREAAYEALKQVTGRDLPFDALSNDAAERARRIKAWQDWWKKEKDRYESP